MTDYQIVGGRLTPIAGTTTPTPISTPSTYGKVGSGNPEDIKGLAPGTGVVKGITPGSGTISGGSSGMGGTPSTPGTLTIIDINAKATQEQLNAGIPTGTGLPSIGVNPQKLFEYSQANPSVITPQQLAGIKESILKEQLAQPTYEIRQGFQAVSPTSSLPLSQAREALNKPLERRTAEEEKAIYQAAGMLPEYQKQLNAQIQTKGLTLTYAKKEYESKQFDQPTLKPLEFINVEKQNIPKTFEYVPQGLKYYGGERNIFEATQKILTNLTDFEKAYFEGIFIKEPKAFVTALPTFVYDISEQVKQQPNFNSQDFFGNTLKAIPITAYALSPLPALVQPSQTIEQITTQPFETIGTVAAFSTLDIGLGLGLESGAKFAFGKTIKSISRFNPELNLTETKLNPYFEYEGQTLVAKQGGQDVGAVTGAGVVVSRLETVGTGFFNKGKVFAVKESVQPVQIKLTLEKTGSFTPTLDAELVNIQRKIAFTKEGKTFASSDIALQKLEQLSSQDIFTVRGSIDFFNLKRIEFLPNLMNNKIVVNPGELFVEQTVPEFLQNRLIAKQLKGVAEAGISDSALEAMLKGKSAKEVEQINMFEVKGKYSVSDVFGKTQNVRATQSIFEKIIGESTVERVSGKSFVSEFVKEKDFISKSKSKTTFFSGGKKPEVQVKTPSPKEANVPKLEGGLKQLSESYKKPSIMDDFTKDSLQAEQNLNLSSEGTVTLTQPKEVQVETPKVSTAEESARLTKYSVATQGVIDNTVKVVNKFEDYVLSLKKPKYAVVEEQYQEFIPSNKQENFVRDYTNLGFNQNYDVSPKQLNSNLNKNLDKLVNQISPSFRTDFGSSTYQGTSIGQIVETRVDTSQRTDTLINQEQVLNTTNIVTPIRIDFTNFAKLKLALPVQRRKKEDLSSSKRVVKGFVGLVRKKGKFVKVSGEILPKGLAYAQAARIAKTTLAQSITVKEAGYIETENGFNPSGLQGFRLPKGKTNLKGEYKIFVQKNPLESKTETTQIQQAKKMKRLFK